MFITDIDECANDNGVCGDAAAHICTNSVGSFTCACAAGYEGAPPNCMKGELICYNKINI